MEFFVTSQRLHAEGSISRCKEATISMDTALSGRSDAFNPAELLLAALSACMIKGIERVAPILKFKFEEVEVEVHAVRQDSPPLLSSIRYTIRVKTDESDQRLELLHTNVRKYGTVFNTVAPCTKLDGVVVRAAT